MCAREPHHRATRSGISHEFAGADTRLPRLTRRARAPARRASLASSALAAPEAPGGGDARTETAPAGSRLVSQQRGNAAGLLLRLCRRGISLRASPSRTLPRREAPAGGTRRTESAIRAQARCALVGLNIGRRGRASHASPSTWNLAFSLRRLPPRGRAMARRASPTSNTLAAPEAPAAAPP